MGANERDFYLHAIEIKGAELTTWIVLDMYRNKGVGPKMISYLKNKYDILIGMGITDDALSVYLRSDFKYIKAIPRFMYVLNWTIVEKYGSIQPLAKKVHKSRMKGISNSLYNKLSVDKNQLDNIFEKFTNENNMFSRTYKSINWRYNKHPNFMYETCIIKSEDNSGDGVFIALRIENTDTELKVLHVIDFFGDEIDIVSGITYIIDYAKNNKITIIDFFSVNTNINKYFIDNGWFSLLDDTYFNFPHLFQPIELRTPATTSLIYWINKKIKNYNTFFDMSKNYITKQDCDFDR